ncbi:Predicted insulinase-like Zn-dependent peptidase DVU0941 [hydrothermal vent metagenome]|uniref:Predicted insulinase-like Zn-dependent peptidase DVU0941 n=1 Tax=hydrothermal vent metagenome TaxID=652676 RepID=A0A3B0Y564_9ZZZZ
MGADQAFTHIRSEKIEALNVEMQEYLHKGTGATHYHLASDNPENVFLVALRTVPVDSTGVAHMLEHTALCGSEKYPVRDPFFMMIRRSLNTFMNAFTSSDWTAYPFASQNRKDYFNLLDVYLDAVFFSRLHELDFAQEGHRVEYNEDGSALEYKGVVYNEMKGAMSSPVSTLWQTMTRYLYPTTTYHFNSGGDPECITDLSYEGLVSFYRRHYHPSNAVFMTYGNIAVEEIQSQFEERVLSRFEQSVETIAVPNEQRYFSPIRIQEHYAVETPDDLENKTHIVIGWLMGESNDLKQRLRTDLLSSILLENSASPLRKALETTDLGAAPSPLCGMDDSYREMNFICGIEGASTINTDAVEAMVLETLEMVATNGVPQEDVEAALHQLELDQREVGGDGYPYGLQLILAGLTPAIHRGDPIALLNLTPVLEELRAEIKQTDFIQKLVRESLLDNVHRVTLTLVPDIKIAARQASATEHKLKDIESQLSDDQKAFIKKQAVQLAERQTMQDDEEILPKVTCDDVPDTMPIAKGEALTANLPVDYYAQGTNGIVYQTWMMPMPQLTQDQLEIMPHFSSTVTELACGENDYLAMQAWQSRVSGGVGAFSSIRADSNDINKMSAWFGLSSKALDRNHNKMCELMSTTFKQVRFDEPQRMRELINQKRARREQSITSNGHGYAMSAASSALSPMANLSDRQGGLAALQKLKSLDDALKDDSAMDELMSHYKTLHEKLLAQPMRMLIVGEKEHQATALENLNQYWPSAESSTGSAFNYQFLATERKQIWVTNSQVSFCAKAFATVPVGHVDAAALTVLGGFLRNGYLHRSIREQGGAYGGGASQDNGSAVFRFYSYRDPRLVETLDDFDKSVVWLLENKHEERQLEEAILGVVGSIDKPGSPSGEAKDAWFHLLHGRTAAARQAFRQQILDVSLSDLQRVTEAWLTPEKATTAVVTHQAGAELLQDGSFTQCDI